MREDGILPEKRLVRIQFTELSKYWKLMIESPFCLECVVMQIVMRAARSPGPIAQRLERLTHNQRVAGSNPAGATKG